MYRGCVIQTQIHWWLKITPCNGQVHTVLEYWFKAIESMQILTFTCFWIKMDTLGTLSTIAITDWWAFNSADRILANSFFFPLKSPNSVIFVMNLSHSCFDLITDCLLWSTGVFPNTHNHNSACSFSLSFSHFPLW